MGETPGQSGLEPSLLEVDFEMTAARWRVWQLSFRDVEDFATVALLRGYDGPALRELAWSHDAWDEIDPLFVQALAEMGMTVPSEPEALDRVARAIARDVALGSKGMLEGAREIRRLYFPRVSGQQSEYEGAAFDPWVLDHHLDELDYFPSEDHPRIERDIYAAVSKLFDVPPVDSSAEGLAPALGGTRAQEEPPGGGSPEPAASRFELHFNIDFNFRRFFNWHWSWNDRQR